MSTSNSIDVSYLAKFSISLFRSFKLSSTSSGLIRANPHHSWKELYRFLKLPYIKYKLNEKFGEIASNQL